jgi:hypothetical protein
MQPIRVRPFWVISFRQARLNLFRPVQLDTTNMLPEYQSSWRKTLESSKYRTDGDLRAEHPNGASSEQEYFS